MSVTLVTSFSKQGWTQYGHRMLESALLHLPKSVEVWVYVEEDPTILLQSGLDFSGRRVRVENLLTIPGGVSDFLAKHGGDPRKWGSGFEREKENFRYNANKFCRKVFAVEHAALHCETDYLFWLDADSFIFDDIPEGWLESLLPAGNYLCHLGRLNYHSDCSFFGFDVGHHAHRRFIERYAGLYRSGEVFRLKEQHDSWVFDYVRKELEQEAWILSHNLSVETKGHVFISSELGRYIDTFKGHRKAAGKSWQEDLKKPRSEPYWQNMPKRGQA